MSVLAAYQPGGAPLVLDRFGEVLAELHPLERRVVSLDSLPDHVSAAFLAVEDRRFHRHRGVDWWRVAGATWSNLRAGERREGGSTLTMQLARTVFPDRIPRLQRTVPRKLLEIRTARRIERRYDKREILELYLNHIYVGGGAYGVEAGARYYFDQAASELSIEEAALLAAVVRAPAHYDPRADPERAQDRRDLVLGLMAAQGRIDTSELEVARARPLSVTTEVPRPDPPASAPFFVEMVRELLEAEFGADLYRARLTIRTTLDPNLQRAAEEELVRQIEAVEAGRFGGFSPPEEASAGGEGVPASAPLEGAVVILDAGTGDILALVGGRDFSASRYNRATRARRPMGSAFKPFVYAAALGAGYVASQPIADRPLTLVQPGAEAWTPRNFDAEHLGPISMRRALVESRNIPTVRLALAVGMEEVVRVALRAGVPEPIPPTPASALGTSLASPLELVLAYGGLAGGGRLVEPRSVTRVEGPAGELLSEASPVHRDGLDPRVAYVLTDILRDVVERGTGRGVRAVGFSGPAAGKTGTSQGTHDVWFAGYSGELVGVVWMGFDRPHPILPGASGGSLAAPVWGRIMSEAQTEARSEARTDAPEGVVIRSVDPEGGAVVEERCATWRGSEVTELFLEEFIPEATCPAPQGFLDQVAGFLRALTGRGDPVRSAAPGSAEGTGAGAPEELRLGDPVERFLGAERVPLREGGR